MATTSPRRPGRSNVVCQACEQALPTSKLRNRLFQDSQMIIGRRAIPMAREAGPAALRGAQDRAALFRRNQRAQ